MQFYYSKLYHKIHYKISMHRHFTAVLQEKKTTFQYSVGVPVQISV